MKYRTLPGTDIVCSEVGFGVWTVAMKWWGITDRQAGIDLLRAALAHGITFFDTADTYDAGAAETILAEAFSPAERAHLTIATKFGYDIYRQAARPDQRERAHNWEPTYVRFAVEESLKRLRRDWIDFYQMHNPRLEALQRDDLAAELEALQAAGKIRAFGAALGPAIEIRQADEADYILDHTRMQGIQIIYNLLEQQIGAPIFEKAREKGVGIFTRVPHASGLLEGNLDENTTFAPGDHRNWRMTSDEKRKHWLERGLRKIEKLDCLTRGTGRTLRQAAVQFILAEPSVVSVLPNIYDAPQLAELAAAVETAPLSPAELSHLADLYAHDFYLDPSEPLARVA